MGIRLLSYLVEKMTYLGSEGRMKNHVIFICFNMYFDLLQYMYQYKTSHTSLVNKTSHARKAKVSLYIEVHKEILCCEAVLKFSMFQKGQAKEVGESNST